MVKNWSLAKYLTLFLPLLLVASFLAGVIGVFADEAKYDGYLDTTAMEGLPLYVSPQGSTDYGEVAYCFNFNKHFPNERGSSENKFSHYLKKEGTAANFIAMAENPRLNTSLSGDAQAEDFRAKVLRVLYNGYPRDNAGLKAKYGATDGQFRMATQYALWYFTDSRAIDASATTYESVINIRKELVELAETTVLPESFTLSIYEPQNVTDSKGYQNLLTSGIYYGPNPDVPVQPAKSDVLIKKTEAGKTQLLSGASLKVVNGENVNGAIVSAWTSSETIKTLSLEKGIYTLVETDAPSGYKVANPITFQVTESKAVNIKTDAGWVAADNNTIHMEDALKLDEKIDISVSKAWDDGNDQDGKRPESVSVNLYADGQLTDKNLTLNAACQWSGTFANLDKSKDGKEIEYTVKEVAVDEYQTVVSGDATKGFTITNSYTPEKVSVAGSKTWNDSGNNDGMRPKSITVRLHKDGQEFTSKTVTEKDDWSWEFSDLDKFRDKGTPVVYTLTEDVVEGYTSQVNGFDITNSYDPEKTTTPETDKSKSNSDGNKASSPSIKNVKTGDNVQLFVVSCLIFVSASGLALIAVLRRSRKS